MELGFPCNEPTPLHADNTNAICTAENSILHERTKHIEIDCHYIHDVLERKIITLVYLPSKE